MLAAGIVLLLAPEPAAAEAELKARQALTEGKVAEALVLYEEAIRAAESTAEKLRLRDRYRTAGAAPPPPLNHAERLVIDVHVRAEKVRVFTAAAERLEGDGQVHAAILLRRVLTDLEGGPESETGKGHIAKVHAIVRKLTEDPSDEDKELVAKILRARKSGPSLLAAGRKLLEERRFKAVVRLCQEMMFGQFDQEVQNGALALRKQAEETAVSEVPGAEKEAALAVLGDERFERLDVALSRHFIFLGPRPFVQGVSEDEKALLDLAYIFQSDLSGQLLTADGARVVVYYQETFDFGGGLAGGKLIRIGDRAIRTPVAGMLHYHELGHCIFGRGWLHDGFTEGLADFAAGFTLDLLGQTQQARQFITDARDQFVRYFLGRDVRYFDIQPYRPSAGFLFSFLPPGDAPYDWAPYRRVFHRMREAQFGSWPDQEHELMRYFGYLLATEYGPETLDLLAEWGWPVERADWGRVRVESEGALTAVKRADFLLSKGAPEEAEELCREALRAMPEGALAARARFGLLRAALARGDAERAGRLRRELGIVEEFLLLGPFHARQRTAHVVLPPETRIDLRAPVRFGIETAHWKPAKTDPTGYVDLRGQGFGYPEHACAFALAYVHVDREAEVRLWTGSDDGHTLYLNNELLEKRATSRAFRFDDDFADGALRPGWNRLLLKVHNGAGTWGFLLRLTDRDGKALPGARFSTENVEDRVARFEAVRTKAFPLWSDDFRGLNTARWRALVGEFDTQNGRLRPRETQKLGLWQRFVVDPDNPKDGPANLLWLKDPDLARADALEVELVVAAQGKDGLPAKFGLTVDGENENDGQSGHTFVLDEHDGKLRCHWYRYDQLLYLHPGAEVPPAPEYRLRLVAHGRKWWLAVNAVPLFEEVDAPRLPAFGLGILTWGRGPEIEFFRAARLEPLR